MENEVVVALPTVTGLATPSGPTAALGAFDSITSNIVLVSGVDGFAPTTLVMSENGLTDVALGNVNVFTLRHVANPAAVDGTLDGFANLLLVAAQKALAVANGLVLAGKATINDLLQGKAPAYWNDHELLRTRRYHSQSNRTCFDV